MGIFIKNENIQGKKMKKEIIPVGKRILVSIIKEEDKKEGLILVHEKKDTPFQGKVIYVSKGSELTLESGDVVLFGRYAGISIPNENKEVQILLLNDQDVLAIVR